jgi:cystinosin
VIGKNPGHLEVDAQISPPNDINQNELFIKIIVANSSAIIVISLIIGWIYFAAWSISFYPQIWENWKRKSVIGLNFDFLALNFFGHTLYAAFNTSMFWNTSIQNEYMRRFPKSVNPVELNDVFFSIHASIITLFTIIQCTIYQRGDQRVSNTARGIISVYFVILVIFLILASVDVVHWLDLLNTCSYIKLSITLIKYIPQAVMNYQRKSVRLDP